MLGKSTHIPLSHIPNYPRSLPFRYAIPYQFSIIFCIIEWSWIFTYWTKEVLPGPWRFARVWLSARFIFSRLC